ncbi:MAG TPA: hypothetical protein VF488_08225, partial [Gemmatimonadaceae bacterium]
VVVATLEAPIDALAGSPIRAALVRELPTEARTALSNLAVGGAGAVRAARSPQTGAPTSPVPSATPQRELPAGAASDPFTAQAVDQAPAATAADQPAVLSSAPLMPAFAPPPLAGSSPDARQPQEGGIGASATRLGVATGDAATRAGTSIGRFFRNRAQAIAGNF